MEERPVLDLAALDIECSLEHMSLYDWEACPQCDIIVEPKMRTGFCDGANDGVGRGVLTARQKARLIGLSGWADFNGGR